MTITIKNIWGDNPWLIARDYFQISLGILIYTIGYTCFLLPYQIISGGVSGISTIVYYSTGFHANYTYLLINIFLLILAIRVMGWRYFFRTIIVILAISDMYHRQSEVYGFCHWWSDGRYRSCCHLFGGWQHGWNGHHCQLRQQIS